MSMCLYKCNTTNITGKLITFLSDFSTAHHTPIFISKETIDRSAVDAYSCKAMCDHTPECKH